MRYWQANIEQQILLRVLSVVGTLVGAGALTAQESKKLELGWEKNYLTIRGPQIPGDEIKIHYLEAYCRAGSTRADWREHTVIKHQTKLLASAPDGSALRLRCEVSDGLIVDHIITSSHDEVNFVIVAHNPTEKRSEAHWAQPCIRLDKFTGADQESYLSKSFIFVDGKLTRMPFEPWATEARYTPGQVWRPASVPEDDVNPRPLSRVHPSNGLIGCFSEDDSKVFAVAFDPWQELFQGVIVCLHSDFRLGGLEPGAAQRVKGKIYILPNDIDALLERYEKDFPNKP